jgi:L,D-transpeptidase YcbB
MNRDDQFRLVLPIALAVCVLAVCLGSAPARAQAPAASEPHTDMGATATKDPFASDDITGSIPTAHAPTEAGATAPAPSISLPDAAGSTPALAPKSTRPNAPAAAPTPLQGFALAIKNALAAWTPPQSNGRQAAELWLEHKDIAAYYAARDYAPLWVHDGKPVAAVAGITARLALAGDDGLSLAAIPQAEFSGAADRLAAAEIAFSEEIVAYGRQASGTRIDPQDINPLIGAKPDVAAPNLILAAVAAAGPDGGKMLQSFNPQQKPYLELREKLVALRQQTRDNVAERPIPPGPSLKLGMTDPRVPLIRARFGLDVAEGDADLIYDPQVAAAVADFQKANGLRPSGIFTPRTRASLAAEQKPDVANEIIANMEVWRWMPRNLGQSRIDVNIPDFEVRVVRDGTVVLTNKVVVGKPSTPTPVFSNTMKFLIVNPYWNVPPSILRKEMLPHLARDPNYLQRMGFETFYYHGHLMVRQPPGEKNALGRIKFMFPNQYSVYLHDTPQRRLFAETKRAFSHGCVRVDQPFDFAQTVLGPKWSQERIKRLVGGKERYVFLPTPLPVHIEYFTAYVDGDGHLVLRNDIYGYEHRIEQALGLVG